VYSPFNFNGLQTIIRYQGGNVEIRRILVLIFSVLVLAGTANADPAGSEVLEGPTETQSNMPDVGNVKSAAARFGEASGPVTAAAAELEKAVPSCESKKTIADTMCLEKSSPAISSFLNENGNLVSMGLAVGGSLVEQCSGIADLLNKAGVVFGAYQAACNTAKAVCASSCTSIKAAGAKVEAATKQAITAISNEVNSICLKAANPAYEIPCQEKRTQLEQAVQAQGAIKTELAKIETGTGKKSAICTGFEKNVQSAMLGAISALQGMVKSKQCEDKNTSDAVVAATDCYTATAPGYSTPNCQCTRGEKSPAECQALNINPNSIKAATIALPPVGTTGSAGGLGLGGLDTGTDQKNLGASSASLGAGAPVEGGGGGASGGGGVGGGGAQDGSAGGRRLNTNILGGGFGGGGGGGSNGAGPGYDSKLKEYMPGGKNDPNRTIASQLAKEVTPQAGRSNWEKVKLRYRDNFSTLLNK
jgi:hypothetical protein